MPKDPGNEAFPFDRIGYWSEIKLEIVNVPPAFIERVFETISLAHWHTFQILTKRAERLAELAPTLSWPANLWIGVSVERADDLHRIEHLRRGPARVRFLSLEPLLGARGAKTSTGGAGVGRAQQEARGQDPGRPNVGRHAGAWLPLNSLLPA